MANPATNLYFATTLEADTSQLMIWDDGGGVFVNVTIPSGTYYYKDSVAVNDILEVLNGLLAAYFTLTRINDRQFQFHSVAANDYILLNPLSNDHDKLASLLGLYGNTSNYDYNDTEHIVDHWITQITESAMYATSGKLYDTADLKGFPAFDSIHYQRQDGTCTSVSGIRRNELKGLTLTALDDAHVRSSFVSDTQGTPGTTQNPTHSASLWQAYNPAFRDPKIYAEMYEDATLTSGHYGLTKAIEIKDVKQSVQKYSGLFDVTLDLVYLGA